MRLDVRTLASSLTTAPTIGVKAQLVRIVPTAALATHSPPDFLYTSGKPGRCNPAAVECVYFSEDETTALAEYWRTWRGLRGAHQPRTLFTAEVAIRHVLDLADPRTLAHLGLTAADLHTPWRNARRPTVTQRLGQAVSLQTRIAAIRYPCDAGHERIGDVSSPADPCNVVIFRSNVSTPDRVSILGPGRKALQRWP